MADARDKLVEAVARAIAAYGTSHFGDDRPLDQQPQLTQAMRRGEARAALSAIEADGWRVVPVEPTLDMAVAGCNRLREFYPDDPDANHRAASYAYVAMLDASPLSPRTPTARSKE